jgi:hypothetical protein
VCQFVFPAGPASESGPGPEEGLLKGLKGILQGIIRIVFVGFYWSNTVGIEKVGVDPITVETESNLIPVTQVQVWLMERVSMHEIQDTHPRAKERTFANEIPSYLSTNKVVRFTIRRTLNWLTKVLNGPLIQNCGKSSPSTGEMMNRP